MAGRVSVVHREGMSLEVIDSGPEDGPVVVLLHGFPQDATCWTDVAAGLNAVGLRTVAPTQRGYSPGARRRGASGLRFAELVDEVLAGEHVTGPYRLPELEGAGHWLPETRAADVVAAVSSQVSSAEEVA